MEHYPNDKQLPDHILQLFNKKYNESEHIGCDYTTVLDWKFKNICVGVFNIKYK